MDSNRQRSQSLDDDDCYVFRNCCNSTFNSDSEYSGSVSVRDMVRHFDSHVKEIPSNTSSTHQRATPRMPSCRHLFPCDSKPSLCDLHISESRNNSDNRFYYNSNDFHVEEKSGSCCKNCTACRCCQNRSRKSSSAIKSIQTNESFGNLNAKDIVAQSKLKKNEDAAVAVEGAGVAVGGGGWLEFKDDSAINTSQPNASKNHLLKTDRIEEANCHQIETSYQSKTTIAKTASGVRIIIDIFFDQEQQCVNASDVLGSRVETDIPQSRILSEFQQQAMAVSATSLK